MWMESSIKRKNLISWTCFLLFADLSNERKVESIEQVIFYYQRQPCECEAPGPRDNRWAALWCPVIMLIAAIRADFSACLHTRRCWCFEVSAWAGCHTGGWNLANRAVMTHNWQQLEAGLQSLSGLGARTAASMQVYFSIFDTVFHFRSRSKRGR